MNALLDQVLARAGYVTASIARSPAAPPGRIRQHEQAETGDLVQDERDQRQEARDGIVNPGCFVSLEGLEPMQYSLQRTVARPARCSRRLSLTLGAVGHETRTSTREEDACVHPARRRQSSPLSPVVR